MFPFTEYPHPQASFQRPVPLITVDPDAPPYVCVRFNAAYMPVVLGCLLQLLLQSTWDTTDRSALDLQRARADLLIYLFSMSQCSTPTVVPTGQEVQLDMSDLIQVIVSDGQCLLQYRCCVGDPWITVAQQTQAGQPGQPGGGATQPSPGGGTACYHAIMRGSSKFYVPTKFNTGDTISIENGSGAISNSHNANWRCIDGEQFFLGQCVGYPQTFSGDPMPGEANGSLIIHLNSTYYSLNHGTFTVPSGVSNAEGIIQANDASITSLSGEFAFDVCVTNNQQGQWTHSWDFRLEPGPFAPAQSGIGVWLPGIGWMDDPSISVTNAFIDTAVFSQNATFLSATVTIVLPPGCAGTGDLAVRGPNTSDAILHVLSPQCSSSPQVFTGNTAKSIGRLYVQLQDNGPNAGVIQGLTVTGLGFDPFA